MYQLALEQFGPEVVSDMLRSGTSAGCGWTVQQGMVLSSPRAREAAQ